MILLVHLPCVEELAQARDADVAEQGFVLRVDDGEVGVVALEGGHEGVGDGGVGGGGEGRGWIEIFYVGLEESLAVLIDWRISGLRRYGLRGTCLTMGRVLGSLQVGLQFERLRHPCSTSVLCTGQLLRRLNACEKLEMSIRVSKKFNARESFDHLASQALPQSTGTPARSTKLKLVSSTCC